MIDLEIDAIHLHPRLSDDGKVELFCHVSNMIDQGIDDAIAYWFDEGEVSVSQRFSLSLALDSVIENHEMPFYDGKICLDAKPILDAMREELRTMIDRIDALKYKGD